MRRSRQGSKKSFSKRRLLQLLVSISLSLLVSTVSSSSSSSSPSSKNLYSILSVPQKATPKEITKAYRKLALKCHPDKVTPEERPKAEKKFKEIGYAHDILSDESKRKRYDMYGEQGLDDNFHPGGFAGGFGNTSGNGNNGGGFGGGGGINMNDIFQQMNQGHAGAGRRSSGASGAGGSNGFHIDLSEILQGFMGGRHPTGMNNPMGNMGMGGMGNMGGMGGTGMNNPMYNRQQQQYQQQQQTQPGQQQRQQQQMKPQIHPFYCTLGELSDPNGHTKKLKVSIEGGYEKIYTIHIQPGWKDGTKIKFKAVRTKDSSGSGSGSSSNNDNIILFPPMTFVLKEKKHKYLKRDGDDLVFTCTVTSRQAMKGAKIKIPLPDGELLEIQTTPNEITKGYTKHIVGKGMPIRRKKNSSSSTTTNGNNKSSSSQEFKTRGDFVVKFRIKEES